MKSLWILLKIMVMFSMLGGCSTGGSFPDEAAADLPVAEAGMPDLVLLDVDDKPDSGDASKYCIWEKGNTHPGLVHITPRVYSIGGSPMSENVTVRIEYDDGTSVDLIAQDEHLPLESGSKKGIAFISYIDNTRMIYPKGKISVDTENLVAESDEDNNTAFFDCTGAPLCELEIGDDYKAEMLDAHNKVRAALRTDYGGDETSFPDLEWSDRLACYAQDWAKGDSILYQNDPEGKLNEDTGAPKPYPHRVEGDTSYFILGENIAGLWGQGVLDSDRPTPTEVVELWATEKDLYDHDHKVCVAEDADECGHYLQIIWSNPYEPYLPEGLTNFLVGCSPGYYERYEDTEGRWGEDAKGNVVNFWFTVCNYSNIVVEGRNPY